MNSQQKSECRVIIHTAAAVSASSTLIPVPLTGFAVDAAVMVTMVMNLARVFHLDTTVNEDLARGMAIAAVKKQLLKHPIKYLTREFSKTLPMAGTAISGGLSLALTEAAGWKIAEQFARNAAGVSGEIAYG
ncbi:MAG: hypothetical protein II922_06025 [Succinimonas sp.]|jgi:uncharacterized protein (DUF697 family)|nr:hypothetical protein [Succinimonas sp.]